ncbi:DUF5723 family protein [Salibacter halophilus]|uniref:Porin family protein n=1 Tax=Salibacter halophilus TaxID=1803916 RepID=A0A6N6M4J6_9FLAO|nr:DUF5723 family protein [Salibacter halophilus]KAB1062137.1 porin family protein [Salibacter halophilus]
MKNLVLPLIVFLFLSFNMNAQQETMLYGTSRIPQSFKLNPAMMPSTKLNIGIPATNMLFEVGKSKFKTKGIVTRSGDGYDVDVDALVNGFEDRNQVFMNFSSELLHGGFKVGNNYFQFNISERIGIKADFPKELAILFREVYEERYINQNLAVNNIRFSGYHTREFGFGYSRKINDKLNVGARFKLLYGVSNFYAESTDLYVDTQLRDEQDEVGGNITYQFRSSGYENYNEGNIENILYANGNWGAGFDLGAEYKFNDRISASASILDLGSSIRFKNDNHNYEQTNINVSLQPMDLVAFYFQNDSLSVEDQVQKFADSLQSEVDPVENGDAYTYSIPTRLFLSGTFDITKKHSVTLINQNIFSDQQNVSYVKAVYRGQIKNFFTGIVGYDLYNPYTKWSNLGLGFSINGGPFQFYLMTEDFVSVLIRPDDQIQPNLRLGMNLTFGKNEDE